jgi:hypothetical protein
LDASAPARLGGATFKHKAREGQPVCLPLDRTQARRSLLFLAVSGEEQGLFGSRYYADNPTVAANQIVANINMDSDRGCRGRAPGLRLPLIQAGRVDREELAEIVQCASHAVCDDLVVDCFVEVNQDVARTGRFGE